MRPIYEDENDSRRRSTNEKNSHMPSYTSGVTFLFSFSILFIILFNVSFNVKDLFTVYNTQKTKENYKNLIKYERLDYLRRFCRKTTTKDFLFPNVENEKFKLWSTVTLIVVFNRPHHYNIPLLQLLYEPWFKKVVYCSTFPKSPYEIPNRILPFVSDPKFFYLNLSESDLQGGYFSYHCTMKILDSDHSEESNYLITADDLLLNLWNGIDLDIVHLHKSCARVVEGGNTSRVWWKSSFGEKALVRLKSKLPNNTNDPIYNFLSPKETEILLEILTEPVWCPSDIYYIPSRMAENFRQLSKLFLSEKVFLEFAVPKMMSVLGWLEKVPKYDIPGKYLWNMSARASPFSYYDKNEIFLHPVKFTLLQTIKTNFCDKYVIDLFKSLSEM